MKNRISVYLISLILLVTSASAMAGQYTVQSFTWTPIMQYYSQNYGGTLIGPAVCTYGNKPLGYLNGASGVPDYSQETYRTIVACAIPDAGIPDNATITSATVTVTFVNYPYNVDQTAKLVSMPPGSSWSWSSSTLWTDAQNGTSYQTGIPANTSTQNLHLHRK